MGMTHGNANTFPHLAQPICYVDAGRRWSPAAEAVVKLFRDHGNRADRKRARIKYVVHDWGVEQVPRSAGRLPAVPARCRREPVEVTGFDLHLGWHAQGDGKWFYGVSVENGRIKDEGDVAAADRPAGDRRAVPARACASRRMQDMLLCDLDRRDQAEHRARCWTEHGVPRPEQLSLVQQLQHGLPGDPDVRPGDLRGGAGAARASSTSWKRSCSELGLDERDDQRPHDRLPQRLRPAVPERHRHRRPQRRQVHALRRRQPARRPAQLRAARTWCRAARSCRRCGRCWSASATSARPGEGFGDFCHRVGRQRLRQLVGSVEPSRVTGRERRGTGIQRRAQRAEAEVAQQPSRAAAGPAQVDVVAERLRPAAPRNRGWSGSNSHGCRYDGERPARRVDRRAGAVACSAYG